MAGDKRERQKSSRQARLAAAAAARQRAKRRRQALTAGVVVVLVGGIVLFAMFAGGDDESTVATSSSTTTPGAQGSAAGKPCVPVTDPLPAGAPAVPVKVGPPPTQLVTEDIKVGDGAVVEANANLTVNYIGVSCSTGKIFDSSYSRNQPANFPLSGVIPGWQAGIPGMKVGGQRLLGIPPDQAYGAQPPASSGISPDETLWFVVEVVDSKPA